MKYEIQEGCIKLTILAKNDGRFRLKTRSDKNAFGLSFASSQKAFSNEVYLEWQIGYDLPVNEQNKKNKTTYITDQTFIGSNKKIKYLFELSEIMYHLYPIGAITEKSIIELIDEITAYTRFIDEMEIKVEEKSETTINGIRFRENIIKLPTLYHYNDDGTQVEVSIQKQQYATGVQPMIYFCIPIKSFSNSQCLIGSKYPDVKEMLYDINKNNSHNIIDLFRVFGMASRRHQHDVLEILNIILRDIRDSVKNE